ncbi:response regulator transcription factor [Granulicella mallensis]|uniref:Two component transcriptional regulator, LuxR family n=1 Tax=Granulicella mallensis (strain ATCC BAA-1857 / DSM 23137 / MP5ACTX8) TaxID=682795 RepID=G8NPQ8_GRAMM|nr:LuxR C-terminal-related transcriptional regulator [Granulicella mallensis]AEU37147.1 two component transcriptional regulator, LuxR family [Granulicella mallensis MP5ACTX8]
MITVKRFAVCSRDSRNYPARDDLRSPAEPGQESRRNSQPQFVFVVDKDYSTRQSLSELFVSSHLDCIAFESATQYLQYPKPDMPSCLVVGLPLPDANGAALTSQMTGDPHPPIVFISSTCDIQSCVRVIKAGAVDYLIKPLVNQAVLKAVRAALDRDCMERPRRIEIANLKARYMTLTTREREVMELVVSGLLNKQAAGELGISEVTLQIHRGKVMRKMHADSLANLVRMAIALEIPSQLVLRTGPASSSEEKGRVAQASQVENAALYADRSGVSSIIGAKLGEDVFDSPFDGIFRD